MPTFYSQNLKLFLKNKPQQQQIESYTQEIQQSLD